MTTHIVADGEGGEATSAPSAMKSPFFADEEIESNRGYSSEYVMRPVLEQLVYLSKHFNDLDSRPAIAYSKKLPALPAGAEQWFVVPRWERVAKSYGEAVEKGLCLIKKNHIFLCNYLADKIGPHYLRPSERTVVALQMIGEKQEGDFLLIPAQFGLTHRGRSNRRAREVMGNSNEFGLGSFIVGCMILSHPERLAQRGQLNIICSGDEYSLKADGVFSHVPILEFYDGEEGLNPDLDIDMPEGYKEIGFDAILVADACEDYGSATGFVS